MYSTLQIASEILEFVSETPRLIGKMYMAVANKRLCKMNCLQKSPSTLIFTLALWEYEEVRLKSFFLCYSAQGENGNSSIARFELWT